MKDKFKKAYHVHKNQGLKGLSSKSTGYASRQLYRVRQKLLGQQETLEQRSLREELGFLANDIFQITEQDIKRSQEVTTSPQPTKLTTATWFVPYFDHFGFGGIRTIFRFIEKLSQEGVSNNIVIYDNPAFDVAQLRQQITDFFPGLTNYQITVFGDDKIASIAKLPASDIAFCTIWVSAYLLLRFNQTKRKYYFIQDYEPLFYVAGSTYALAESTYRFGFKGIVNTPGLLDAINQRHGLEGVSFIPAVDQTLYYPDPNRNNQKVRIFFYARPLNPRNAFNLGILTIRQLLDLYGDKIEIITAGSNWNEAEYGLKGKITNLGLIESLEDVAALYRSCDIGFSFMLNKHPSYQMLEYAASGVATVMNDNEDHHWLYKDKDNCLLAEPSPADMTAKISQLIDNPELRQAIVRGAQKTLVQSWPEQMAIVWQYIKPSDGQTNKAKSSQV